MSSKHLESKQNIWGRELEFSKQPRFWKSFATELHSCASLIERNWDFFNLDEDVKGGIQEQFFFAPKFIRMLWGFSLENLIKGILMAKDEEDKYVNNSGHISWGNKGHDLVWLTNELGYSPNLPEKWSKIPSEYKDIDFYLTAWGVSTLWYGKYPFPAGMNGVLDEYKALASSEALLRRREKGNRKFILNDLLHTDINRFEKEIYDIIYNDLSQLCDELQENQA